jgi:hypothetical protein
MAYSSFVAVRTGKITSALSCPLSRKILVKYCGLNVVIQRKSSGKSLGLWYSAYLVL